MSSCAAPAWSPCRTGRGKVAARYHTARSGWCPASPRPSPSRPAGPQARLGLDQTAPPRGGRHGAGRARAGRVRRASTVRQSLATQTDSLKASASPGSSPRRSRPARSPAPSSTRPSPSPGRSARPAPRSRSWCTSTSARPRIELAALAEQLRAAGIGLEFLTGSCRLARPSGSCSPCSPRCRDGARVHRDRTLEGHESARARGKSIGGAAVTDERCSLRRSTCAARS